MPKRRLQSAMEYLMTYGWAILIIAVVLGALYQLGVFGSSQSVTAQSCIVSPGYICSNPVMNTSGYLGVTFGQIGTTTITLTGMGCTTNSTTPSITQLLNLPLNSGSTSGIAVSCPIAANSIGTGFKGFIWIRYDNPTQTGIIDRIGVVTAKVSTAGSVLKLVNGGTGGYIAAPFSATGGTITFAGGNEIHTFTSNGIFTATGGPGSVAALVVAGGGGGGEFGCNTGSGGGGAGGFSYSSGISISSGVYSVTVGTGGAGGGVASPHNGLSGANSTFSTITTVGGGGGSGSFGAGSSVALSGGSGGGGSYAGAGASGTAGQGNSGGTASSDHISGGGGGGAGAVGGAGTNIPGGGGAGGIGLASSISGSSVYYAGGGGGATNSGDGTTAGAGGLGGGGAGSGVGGGTSGTANTGGGGGGSTCNTAGGAGGSGIVIISFNQLGNGTP